MSGQSLDPRHQFLAQVPFFACRDVPVPGTVGDLVSHAHVRVAFLNELLPREGEELFHDWEARTGIEGKARKWKEARDWGLSLKSGDPDYLLALTNYEAAAWDFGGEMWSAGEFFLCEAWRFQRQLGLSCSWLSEELEEQFIFWMFRQISGWTQKSMLVH
jgi:hypothetical protein